VRYWRSVLSRRAWYAMTCGCIMVIFATFASDGLDGVHRWLSIGGFKLHASAIFAPVIIACVATIPSLHVAGATAVTTAILLALQPDAAQACSFAASCGLLLVSDRRFGRRAMIGGLIALITCSIVSLVRADPLNPVEHVEGIYKVVAARGPGWASLATVTLVLLPMPFFLIWARHHRPPLALALATYVALVTIAPTLGTFPVPIMGYGVSPILGYYIALALSARLITSAAPVSRRRLFSPA
jgi:cell division protein FtsW (lipid II flippase)